MPPGGVTPGFEKVPEIPEQQTEALDTGASFESPAASIDQVEEPVPVAVPVPSAPAMPAVPKDPTVRAVEAILEEDLGASFGKMDPAHRMRFRKEGERVTSLIVEMVKHAKINARIVLKLIVGWLKMIPSVNQFFLAQEAKIKTDRILKL